MKRSFTIGLCLVIALSACIPTFGQPTEEVNANDAVQTAVAGTKAVENAVATSVALTAAANQPPPSQPTEPPAEQATEPPPPPPTEPPAVSATVKVNAYCRKGPASTFEYLVVLQAGEGGNVIGKNTQPNVVWYQLELPDGKQCWVANEYLEINGDTSNVSEVASPPTPTPKPPPSWAGTWTIYQWWTVTGSMVCNQPVTFYQTGNTVTASWTCNGLNEKLTGTSSADGMTLTGNILGLPFIFERVPGNLNQFRGIYTNTAGPSGWDGDFCGYKDGAPKPSPCRIVR